MKQLSRQINQATVKSTTSTTTKSNSTTSRKSINNHNFKIGDPIVFASNSNSSASNKNNDDSNNASSSTGFSFGQAIKFGEELNHEPLLNNNSPSATRGNSSPHYANTTVGDSSWHSHRFVPPSPSLSPSLSDATARFSFTRSYNNIRNTSPSPSPNRSLLNSRNDGMSEIKLEVDVSLNAGVVGSGTWLFGRVDVGVQAGTPSIREKTEKKGKVVLSQNEVENLLGGIDFEEAFDMDEDSDYHSAIGTPTKLFEKIKVITKRTPLIDLNTTRDLFSPIVPSSSSFVNRNPYPKSSTPFLSPSRNNSSPSKIPHYFPPISPSPLSSRLSSRAFSASPSSNFSQTLIQDEEVSESPHFVASTKFNATRTEVIEINDSDSDISLKFTSPIISTKSKGKGKQVIELSDDDDDVVILPTSRIASRPLTSFLTSRSIHTSSISSSTAPNPNPAPPKPIRAGFFIKPASLKANENMAIPEASTSTLEPILAPVPRAKYRTKPDIPLSNSTSTSTFPTTKARAISKTQAKKDKDLEMRNKYSIDFDWRGDPMSNGKNIRRPELIYTRDEKEVERVLKLLKSPLGFDLEWKPTLRKGAKENKTALVQVCDQNIILLVHIAKMSSFPECLKSFIEDPTKIKLGVQIGGDGQKLKRDFDFSPAGLLELNNVGRTLDPVAWSNRSSTGLIGLQKLCGTYLNRFLPKDSSVRCGDWNRTLSVEQQHYAANDVYSSLQIFLYQQSLAAPGQDLVLLASNNSSTASRFQTITKPRPSQPLLPFSTISQSQSTSTSKFIKSITEAGQSKIFKSLTPRQQEVYQLYIVEKLDLDLVTNRMSQTRKIVKLSVVWHLLTALSTPLTSINEVGETVEENEGLAFEKVRLEEALSSLGESPKYRIMVSEKREWLKREGINY